MGDISLFYDKAIENLASFQGSGLLFELSIVCVFFLFFYLKDSPEKHLLTWLPLGVLIVYFFPLWTVYVSLRDDAEVLYRILWLVPLGVITAYTLVRVIEMGSEKARPFLFAGAVLLIIVSGEYTYGSEHYSKAENIYHVPQEVVDICDEIEVPGREIRACFPEELVQYVRQYSSVIFLTFGRDSLITNYRSVSEIQDLLREDVIPAKEVADILRETETPYLIVSEDRVFDESLWDYNFAYVTNIDGYDIYLDNEAYIGLWEDENNG